VGTVCTSQGCARAREDFYRVNPFKITDPSRNTLIDKAVI
jgi:hypothetical protein